ncbi:hypothetical protein F0L17_16160 [Streptomyces sp. TRM43335]|uniref:DUF3558 domain-containing protein n=1 Tax=Streptomyces taklimakanensis TaxID=2569853 RepID=A0A6G2BEX1_9ACTN|nr:hypothetical protein [Streptomyces taklimakanensis]MTE20613.1 hypothetical protein [Streptomyces taklimakanensis]
MASTSQDPHGSRDTAPSPGDLAPPTPRGSEGRPTRGHGRTWAAGLAGTAVGAVCASALWLSGLLPHTGTPDLKGYGATNDLCAAAELKALTAALGEREEWHNTHREHPAMDRAWCMMDLERAGQRQSYTVMITYELHKEVDPGPDFEAWETEPDLIDGEKEGLVDPVPNLGDSAYEIRTADASHQELSVRDGGAVIRLQVSTFITQQGIPETNPDFVSQLGPTATREHLLADMKDLMAALKR